MTGFRRALRSSRGRLVLWILLAIVVVALALSFFVSRSVRDRFTQQIDRELAVQITSLREVLAVVSDEQLAQFAAGGTFSNSDYLLVSVGGGHDLLVVPSGDGERSDPLPDLSPSGLNRVRARAGDPFELQAEGSGFTYRALVSLESDGRMLLVATPLSQRDDAVETVQGVVVLVGLISAVVLAGAVVCVTGWITKPLTTMIATAEEIGAGNAEARVPTDGVDDVARLASALNAMLDRLQGALAETEASEAALRRFVADASHELRTPLAAILGYAELHQSGIATTPAQLGSAMDRIAAEAGRMHELVEELLLLARLEEGRARASEPVDLVALVELAAQDARVIAPDRPVEVVADTRGAVVQGEALSLRQAVDNLLANVPAHTPAGTPTYVQVERHADEALITVRDEGPGLTAEEQAKVFERFYRSEASRARPGGAGLGLAIVAAVAEHHGGSVSVHSTPGRGAAFTLRLPGASAS